MKISQAALVLAAIVSASACSDAGAPRAGETAEAESLVGVWRAQMRFAGGAFADMKDLEFMYAFNAGGTMTESSNYDSAPPVPPAYGVWKKTGPRQFEIKYVFYNTKAPAAFEDIAKGGGWLPAGVGVFTEKISLSEDGKSYKSAVTYVALDPSGKAMEGGGDASSTGKRLGF